jgi:hypothetical protein
MARLPGHGNVRAYTRDVSSRGVSFSSPAPLPAGAKLQFVMTLPSEITLSVPMRVQCAAHVIRTQEQDGRSDVTIAAIIDQYEFLAD